MGDIKSAFELAMEKVSQMEDPTEEEKLQWKYVPEGEKLAGRYIKEKVNLLAELNNYDEKVRKFIVDGATGILARNISLPINDHIKQTNKKVMDGLKIIKSDKGAVENVFSKIRYIFNHYAEQGKQQKDQAYESLKVDIAEKIQAALKQQMSPMMGMKIDVEKQPQFQQEWRKIQQQIDSQYISHLNDYIRELIEIP